MPADVTAVVTPGQETLDIILADHKLTAALTNRDGMVPLVTTPLSQLLTGTSIIRPRTPTIASRRSRLPGPGWRKLEPGDQQ